MELAPWEMTRALHASGTLQHGEVVTITVREQRRTAVSHLRWLEVEYNPGSSPALPNRLLLKWPLEPSAGLDNSAETTFYREFAPTLPSPPIVRCLAMAPLTNDEQWLLLEDMRSTHECPPWPGRPSDLNIQEAVAVLARVHAPWWERTESSEALGAPHSEATLRAMVNGIKAHLPGFLQDVGEDLPQHERQVLEAVFGSPLKPWLRLADQRDLTLIHGDAHTWNFLFPRAGPGTPYLIDWQTWHRDVGARDLAFMMALHWDRVTRQRLERPLLELYHQELMKGGVTGYSIEDLTLDYRRCAVRNLTFPIIFWSRGFPRESWRYRLDCALAAYHDLDGEELL